MLARGRLYPGAGSQHDPVYGDYNICIHKGLSTNAAEDPRPGFPHRSHPKRSAVVSSK